MATTQAKMVETISKPPWKRTSLDINAMIPWLQKKSDLLKDLEKGVLQDIVRNCNCLQAEEDDIIIKQGDKGNSLFIILSGLVSVYVDGTKSTEQIGGGPAAQVARTAFDVEQKAIRVPGNNPNTPAYSESGESYYSSRGDKSHREDTSVRFEKSILGSRHPTIMEQDIIKEESPDLAEVCVLGKASQRKKYGDFLVKFAAGKCFGEIALISSECVRNATIIADEDCNFLVIKRFLYNKTLKAFQEEEYADRADFVQKHPLFKSWHSKFKKLLEMSLIKEVYGYDCPVIKQGEEWKGLYFLRNGKAQVLVEPSRHNTQYPELSPFRDSNDVFETELGIPNKRLSPISRHPKADRNRTKAVERVFVRRHDGYAAAEKRVSTRCIELLTIGEGEIIGDIELVMNLPTYFHSVISKTQTEFYVLNVKNFDRLVTKRYPNTVDVVKLFVETKLRNRSTSIQGSNIPLLKHLLFRISGQMKSVMTPKTLPVLRASKELPQREILFQHLVKSFKENKAELCEPLLPGAIYLRDIMREKARVRHNQKEQKMKELKEKRRRTMKFAPPDKPRTTKELKAALERQRMEEEEVERKILLEEIRAREADELRKMELNTINLKNFVVQFQDPILMGHDGMNNNNSNARTSKESIPPSFLADTKPTSREKTFITEIEQDLIDKQVNQESQKPKNPETQSNPEGQYSKIKSSLKHMPRASSVDLGNNDDDDDDDLLVDDEGDPLSVSRQGFINDHIKKSEEQSRAASKMKFVNALMRKGVRVPENPEYRDWETSDKSMRYLEERIARFAKKYGEKQQVIDILPKLRRFHAEDDSLVNPRPGGKVIVKPRACIQKTTTQGTLSDHNHHAYHIVPKIDNYEKLKKAKMVFQRDLGNKREQWMKAGDV